MKAYIADTETNGLLPAVTKMHSLVLRNIETNAVTSCADQHGYTPIADGLSMLEEADLIVGHNWLKYDGPVIRKLYPSRRIRARVRDTLLLSRLLWPEVRDMDFARVKKGSDFPKKLIGRYSLKAWGYRLGILKGEFGETTDWQHWSPEMQTYCEGDISTTSELWSRIVKKGYSERAIELEHRFQEIIFMQEQHGVFFDIAAAQRLTSELAARRQELEVRLQDAFRPWFSGHEVVTPKKTIRYKDKPSVLAGAPYTKVQLNTFNPGSRDHIANRLKALHGWEPTEFTQDGKAKVDDSILEGLTYPEATLLGEYLMLQKRLGQISEGNQAWLKKEKDGRIHGRVETVGAVTRRCTHQDPNLAQVPSVKLKKVDGKEVPMLGAEGGYGHECRDLFIAPPGMRMVGGDASGLELRCLGHYMGKYDGGAYARIILEGDVHTTNKEAAGLYNRGSPGAKTFIYAYLYGAGDEKLGTIVVEDARLAGKDPFANIDELRSKQGRRWDAAIARLKRDGRTPTKELVATIVMGSLLKARFLAKTPALKRLKDDVASAAKTRGYLKAIDGGILQVRSAHSALNTLLQSCGAILVKAATNILWDDIEARGLVYGRDVAQCLHVHDEVQLYVKEELADEVGKMVVEAIRKAGVSFNFRCPLDGAYKIGRTWADTH